MNKTMSLTSKNLKNIFSLLLILVMVLTLLKLPTPTVSAVGENWYHGSWGYRIPITISNASINADLSDFPVYVDLGDLGSTFWSNVNSGCGDIRVTESDGSTQVPREIVSCTNASSTGELHFKATSLSSSASSLFYIYFDNSGASDYAITATYGAENVWTNGYLAVYHMEEDPSGSSPQMIDSTSNGYDGTTVGSMTSTDLIDSQMGKGLELDGANDYVNIGNITSFTGDDLTVSAWYKVNNFDIVWQALIAKQEGDAFRMARNNTNNYLNVYTGDAGLDMNTGTNVNDSSWHLVHGIQETGGIARIYHDGDESASSTGHTNNATNASDIWIGNNPGATSRWWDGVIDEVRLSDSVARDSAWINAEYINQSSPASFYSVGSAASEGTGRAGYVILTGDVKFRGDLVVGGAISKGSGTFVIDHPLDPANKLLYHSFVESPDVKNIYDGIATIDENGEVQVLLPDYFEALNDNYRYQVKGLSSAQPNLHVKQGVLNNAFVIAGGTAGATVSWQVTGIRKDPYILKNPIIPEVEKGPDTLVKKGEYLFKDYKSWLSE